MQRSTPRFVVLSSEFDATCNEWSHQYEHSLRFVAIASVDYGVDRCVDDRTVPRASIA